jgi:hypothetical protein
MLKSSYKDEIHAQETIKSNLITSIQSSEKKLGKNFVLFGGVLALDMHSWFIPLQKHLPRIRKEYDA